MVVSTRFINHIVTVRSLEEIWHLGVCTLLYTHCVPRVLCVWLKSMCSPAMEDSWNTELCSTLHFGLLLYVTIFWQRGSIPPFDPFEQTGSVGSCWDRWKTHLQYYIDAHGITVDNRKWVLLIHLARPAIQDIFTTLSDTGTSYMEALTMLSTYFTPQKSLQFEQDTFRQAHQAPNESISQYITRLRRLGEHCDFDKYSLDEAIKTS